MSFKTVNDIPRDEILNIFKSLNKVQLEVLARELRSANFGNISVAVNLALQENTMKKTDI